ncbi:hypothetical protein AJ79_04495 [Helicocarpus griseus UAMH5409]|uniref:F-box domain-containing protein n=1 Tax=Helicocarpus griseus UAMH5409 TaxID=1447875 RepID=A0A2B7XSA2_9EURO|nr:hypothetical protein AJ79_04495 [Helicocarpus griseus UAMH5409]
MLLEIVRYLGPGDQASLALISKGAYKFSREWNFDLEGIQMPLFTLGFYGACSRLYSMEYERLKFLRGLQRDSTTDIACIWCLKTHSKNKNSSLRCARDVYRHKRIDSNLTACHWQIIHHDIRTIVGIVNFKNIDEESQQCINRQYSDCMYEWDDGRYTISNIIEDEEPINDLDPSRTAGEEYITIRAEYEKFLDRLEPLNPQTQNTSINVCKHIKFPDDTKLFDMVCCKAIYHPDKLHCRKCAGAPRHCDKCHAIFDFNVKPAKFRGVMSRRYVLLQTRVLYRINAKSGKRAIIEAIESSMPNDQNGPLGMNTTWQTAQYKNDLKAEYGWTAGDIYNDEMLVIDIPPRYGGYNSCFIEDI